ncbi:AAA family ATPase [Roseivivax sediminis]|uniref:ATPase family associated with various cellular activities (AAA) n=1 Tax=Roseivivax sediminis TaxID=936889 RepID=A0A1I2EHW7_9RHOB|nr:AAA family ATPase [Roseivivax sediminis]SFE92562.1 ATPase family associated with various cellular activities (AAA) [Roseivivax sediminis]
MYDHSITPRAEDPSLIEPRTFGWHSLIPARYPVLLPELNMASEEDYVARFQAFVLKLKRNLDPERVELQGLEHRRGMILGKTAYRRRAAELGLSRLEHEDLLQVKRLARDGAVLHGPRTEHHADELAAALHAESPWMSDIGTFLTRAMRSAANSGLSGLTLPPMILVGPPGCGKSHYARKLGELAGTPVRQIDVGSGTSAHRVAGTEKGWSSRQSGVPTETVLDRKVANPVMVVDEIDKAGTIYLAKGSPSSLITALLTFLEPSTAKVFECPSLRVTFDLSRVNWVLTANVLEDIPAVLRDRCRVFLMPEVTPGVAGMMVDAMARDFPQLDAETLSVVRREVTRTAARGKMSLRIIRRILEDVSRPPGLLLH